MQQTEVEYAEAVSWAMQAWGWLGEEVVEFGLRWIVFLAIGVVVTLIFRSKLRADLDQVIEHLGMGQAHTGIRSKKILSWLKPTAKPPVTRTWIDRKNALKLIKNSSVVLEKSPRRKEQAKNVFDMLAEQVASHTVIQSGEDTYRDQFEIEVSIGLLDVIISKHPHAKQSEKYSREIIAFELCQMALNSALGESHD